MLLNPHLPSSRTHCEQSGLTTIDRSAETMRAAAPSDARKEVVMGATTRAIWDTLWCCNNTVSSKDTWIHTVFTSLLLALDALLCVIIVKKVAYTEIDWQPYMQEVQGYLDGERNYVNIRGSTGPLVYPAGFLYVYSMLYQVTDAGANVLLAQYIFVVIYVVNLLVVLLLYRKGKTVPPIMWILLLLSRRIHSLFVLRLFNDCIAVLFGYAAIVLFTHNRYHFGCLSYSFAVSIKMNIFLFAPGIFLILLIARGIYETISCIALCALLQLVLGYPFLSTYPISYISKAFELNRVFDYKWTVNLRFLPEEIFVSKGLSLLLLLLTILAYSLFSYKWITSCRSQVKSNLIAYQEPRLGPLSSHFIIITIFTSNFIGIVFARTLHYQFYSWYFHMLPYLLWHAIRPSHGISIKLVGLVALLLAVEYSFNVYPSTDLSSGILQCVHVATLLLLWRAPVPLMYDKNEDKNE